jgi:chromosome segregation protein
MFKLQRLEITGFKSFADYTEIVFTGNGITAVVGPNGCGKSNVSDSISWVLGEQRAKSLRGGEMKDVVFQGTKNRKPSGMAEVVLHMVRDEDAVDFEDAELEDIDETLSSIDELAVDVDAIEAEQAGVEPAEAAENIEVIASDEASEPNGFHEDVAVEKVQAAQVGSTQIVERTVKTKRHWRPRSFALDFAPGEAVSVTRRLYLSGESEYLLNGKTCRLRDIQDLFAGTGLSGSHYAIVEQGRIGQILSAKPGDRRNLIEEAAGISKFRTRQRAAESRLESAKTNLGRISDIVSEIEKQANSLRRQASKTRRYVILQEEFRVLLRQLFAAEGKHFSTLITELEAQLTKAASVEKEFIQKVADQENSVRTATQEARLAEEALAEVRRQHSQNALERDRTEREHRYQTEQIIALNQRLETLQNEIVAATERQTLAESERSRLEVEEQKEGAEADASRLILIEAEKQYGEKIGDVRKIEKEMEEARGELLKHTAAVERFDEIARQLSLNLERLHERSAGLASESARADESYESHVSESQTVVQELAGERKKLEDLQSEKSGLAAEASTARDSLAKAEATLKNSQADLARTRNRLETLQELEEKRAVYAPQVQKLFAAQESIGVNIRGVLADYLNVEERAERAVENLFGVYLQAVLVEDYADAKRLSEWLHSTGTGRVPILIAPGISSAGSGKRSSESASTVAQALGTSDAVLTVLREAFPRELSARLVDSLNGSPAAAGSVVVDLIGDMLVGGSLMVSGNAASAGKNESLLAFKRELSVLARESEKLSAAAAAAEQFVTSERTKLTEIEERTVDLQSVIIKVERHLLSLEIRETNLKQEIERAERHRRVVSEESAQIKAEITEIEGRIVEARESRTRAESSKESAQENLTRIGLRLADAREQADAENTNLNQKRTLAATSGERRRSVQAALDRVANEIKELGLRIQTLKAETAETETRIEALRNSVSEISNLIGSVDSAVTAERQELESAISAVAIARQKADVTAEELSDLNRRSADAMNERAAIEVRQTEAVTHLKNIQEHCHQELGTSLNELVASEEIPEGFELTDARTRTDDLRERLEGFGAINMLAVDELAEADERLLFLTSQRQDIIDSISSAEEALREIKQRSRERFRLAFHAINENFKEFFSELFGGGHGEMSLLESDDILEAGIEVVAQPPGKRLQNILLLSGGEKAMTAIALVLAIFKYRPSPFCLLDEVDAPLDDANVGRFVSKIADMSEKTQFIVITHNKRTMEAARALYGVTMQEAGVSKVVSVRFE